MREYCGMSVKEKEGGSHLIARDFKVRPTSSPIVDQVEMISWCPGQTSESLLIGGMKNGLILMG